MSEIMRTQNLKHRRTLLNGRKLSPIPITSPYMIFREMRLVLSLESVII